MTDSSAPDGAPRPPAPTVWGHFFQRFSHETLAYVFVLGIFLSGVLLTALLIVQALTWGLLSSFGRARMVGLLISFASAGLVISRLLAGRYGNQLAAMYMPQTLPFAVSARVLMRDFGLGSAKELTAFLVWHKLRVYSARASRTAETAVDLACMLEPLFTHNMYLPMMRAYFLKTNRLWFDARAVNELIAREKERAANLRPFAEQATPPIPPPGGAD